MLEKPKKLRRKAVTSLRKRGPIFWAMAAGIVVTIALLVGSQIAHDQGQSVNWYTGFGQWLGALGSFTATIAALYIATSDRKARERERLAAAEAQARLVRIDSEFDKRTSEYVLTIKNYGERPIIEVGIDGASLHTHPDIEWRESIDNVLEVVQPQRESPPESVLRIQFHDKNGATVPRTVAIVDVDPVFEAVDKTPIVAVHFTDANGIEWITGPYMNPEISC